MEEDRMRYEDEMEAKIENTANQADAIEATVDDIADSIKRITEGLVQDNGKKLDRLESKIVEVAEEVNEIHSKINDLLLKDKSSTTARHETIAVNPDSLTLGAPTTGQFKVYGDFNKREEFIKKVVIATDVLEKAKG